MSAYLTKNARIVLEKRYLKKDPKGKVVESVDAMFDRVARNIAKAELLYGDGRKEREIRKEFFTIMSSLDFLPNSPTLMNAGRELQQLSACFVIPIEDSLESIFDALKATALIHQSGGGTGFSFSRLRPKGDVVQSTHGIASGPVSFMRIFNMATEVIKQGGTRRGANMGVLRCDHPDIEEFINCKRKRGEFVNFNLSVGITDKFMRCVEEDRLFYLINPRDGRKVKKVRAREIFELIVDAAWDVGDPGVLFLDTINRGNTLPALGYIEATNPCGEQPLLPWESCNLGSINLSQFVRTSEKKKELDYDRLEHVVRVAVRFLDNVIDMNVYPIKQIERMTKDNRKIGLGVMGFADMLIQLGIPYDSEEAIGIAERVMGFIRKIAYDESERLARERGPFPNIKKSIFYGKRVLRNATLITVAPTGTLSIIAGCSSGIEPIFGIVYLRRVLDDEKLIEENRHFMEIAKNEGFYSDALMDEINRKGTICDIKGIPERIKRLFRTAVEISPEVHVRMQAAFQKYIDSAVSKTINLPEGATREDVRRCFLLAYELGCKGVTVFRSSSRAEQVLTCGTIPPC